VLSPSLLRIRKVQFASRKNQKAGRLPRKYQTKERKWPFETQESAESLVKQLSQTKVNNSNILVGRQMGLIPFWEKGWPEASDNFWADVNSIEKLWNKVKSECRKSVKLRICVRCILFHPLIYCLLGHIWSHSIAFASSSTASTFLKQRRGSFTMPAPRTAWSGIRSEGHCDAIVCRMHVSSVSSNESF